MYFLFENVLICMTCAASFAASFIEFIDVFKHFKYLYQNEKSFIKEWFAKVIFWKWIASSFLLKLTNLWEFFYTLRPLQNEVGFATFCKKIFSIVTWISIPFNVSTIDLILFQSSLFLDSISKYNWYLPEGIFLVSKCTIFFSFT